MLYFHFYVLFFLGDDKVTDWHLFVLLSFLLRVTHLLQEFGICLASSLKKLKKVKHKTMNFFEKKSYKNISNL